MEKYQDKKAYSYKEALDQPTWLRSFGRYFKTSTAFKFSRVVYMLLFFLPLFVLFRLVRVPLNYSLFLSVGFAFWFAVMIEDLKIDGRMFFFYFIDYLKYYLKIGIKADEIYINKGEVYRRNIELEKGLDE